MNWYFLEFCFDFFHILGETISRLQVFFPRVKSVSGPLLQYISSKSWFSKLLKTVKKWHLTWKFSIFSKIPKRIFWVSGFGFKISEAIFSTSQNVIWTHFEWFRVIWKSCIFSKFSCFFQWFLPLKYASFWILDISETCRFWIKVDQKSIFSIVFHVFELLHLLRLPAYSGCLSKPFALPYLGIRRSAQTVGLIGTWFSDGADSF